MINGIALLVTCEHGGNVVPPPYEFCFRDDRRVLDTHRAYDRGALELARQLADYLGTVLIESTVTRLLVDLNRSLTNPRIFSPYTGSLDGAERKPILEQYYHPYRCQVERTIEANTRVAACTVHISVHSFTPCLNGIERNADVGLLYDPTREAEKRLCRVWQQELGKRRPDVRIRRNYPYRGTDDGLTRYLRRRFDVDRYLGIELEINQSWPATVVSRWRGLRRDIIESLSQCLRHRFHPGLQSE